MGSQYNKSQHCAGLGWVRRAVAGSEPEGKLFLLRDDEDLLLSAQ